MAGGTKVRNLRIRKAVKDYQQRPALHYQKMLSWCTYRTDKSQRQIIKRLLVNSDSTYLKSKTETKLRNPEIKHNENIKINFNHQFFFLPSLHQYFQDLHNNSTRKEFRIENLETVITCSFQVPPTPLTLLFTDYIFFIIIQNFSL